MSFGIIWKSLAVALVFYTLIFGFLGEVPRLPILNETIRNLYFHVTMWFGMMIILLISLIYSIKLLSTNNQKFDIIAAETANTGILFGTIGIVTGMIWAKFTWGVFWISDPKLNGAAITLLIYLAYLVLRNSIDDPSKKSRISAVYNIFSFVMLTVFLIILPRMTDSLHPGNGGNPGFNNYDLDSKMRLVFYPAIVGWTLIGIWIASLRIRLRTFKMSLEK